MKKLFVFASGEKDSGGSGFQELVEHSRAGILNAEIIGVVSNHPDGGVRDKSRNLNIPFIYFSSPWTKDRYKALVENCGADFVALSGWLKMVKGLDPKKVFNIHPGPLPRFGGDDYYGHHVHKTVIDAFRKGEIKNSAVCMHFITDKPEYDDGPVFFHYPVLIREDDTSETLGARVNKIEHAWQSYVTNLVVAGEIRWDGRNRNSLVVPSFVPRYNPDYS